MGRRPSLSDIIVGNHSITHSTHTVLCKLSKKKKRKKSGTSSRGQKLTFLILLETLFGNLHVGAIGDQMKYIGEGNGARSLDAAVAAVKATGFSSQFTKSKLKK